MPTPADLPTCIARGTDPVCVRYLPHIKPENQTTEKVGRFLNFQNKETQNGNGFWVVIDKKTEPGKAIGDGGFCGSIYYEDAQGQKVKVSDANGDVAAKGLIKAGECGIMLDSGTETRGKGYAVEVMEACFSMGFEGGVDGRGLGLEKVSICTSDQNKPMRGVCERRLGLKPVENMNGQTVIDVSYTLTREEWLSWRSRK